MVSIKLIVRSDPVARWNKLQSSFSNELAMLCASLLTIDELLFRFCLYHFSRVVRTISLLGRVISRSVASRGRTDVKIVRLHA